MLEAQQALREQLEREPARFFNREAPVLLNAARKELAQLLNAPYNEIDDYERLAAALRALALYFWEELGWAILVAASSPCRSCASGSLPTQPTKI